MAKYGSDSFGFLLIGGYNFINSSLQGLSWKREAKTEMTHGLGATAELPTPVGVAKYTLAQSGAFFDDTAAGAHALLAAGATGVSRIVCFTVSGNTSGAPFVGCLGALTVAYEVLGQDNGITKANAEYQITGHAYDGQIIQPLATKTADWDTDTLNTEVDYTSDTSQVVIPLTSNSAANPTVVTTTVAHGLTTGQVIMISGVVGSSADINGERTVTVTGLTTFTVPINATVSGGTGGSFVRCSTVAGCYSFLEVSACSGFTNFVATVRDSADNVTYATLATHTDNVTAPYAETVTNGAETINRYVTVQGNVTGTGSITCMVGLVRL